MEKLRKIELLSLVISVFNEEDVLEKFWGELKEEFSKLACKTEIIFVNDGSYDKTHEILSRLSTENGVRVIRFSRNFGHEAAMLAGIDHARGDAIICLDADGQHPPSKIVDMVSEYSRGIDIVNMIRNSRADHGLRGRVTSRFFYKIINRISPVSFQENASDFFLISDRVARVLRTEYRERTRFLRGFIQIIGFKKSSLSFDSEVRLGGESKYSFSKLMVLSVNAIVSFSKLPLHLGLVIGALFGLFALIVGIYSVAMWLIGEVPEGYTTLIVFIAFSFAMVFFLIGLLGVYIGFMLEESKKRPIYIIESLSDNEGE